MSGARKLLAAAVDAAVSSNYVDEVFLANIRSGTGATVTVTGGPDMSTLGGLCITKARSTTTGWRFTDTTRGVTKSLDSSSTAAEATEATGLTAFTSSGATFGADADYNASGQTFVDYFFGERARFFKKATVVHTTGTPSTVDLSSLGTVGFAIVKSTGTSDWWAWHRSLTAGNNLRLNTTAAQSATNAHLSVSGTTLTIASGMASGTYVVYALTHDSAADGIIQCGSVTTDGSGNATVGLGWEPQYLQHKIISTTGDWHIRDSSRSFLTDPASPDNKPLFPNLSNGESASTGFAPTASGFRLVGAQASHTYVYIAIRRSNKPPTSGTQVYNAVARTGTGANATITGVGFPPDLTVIKGRSSTDQATWFNRLRGATLELYSHGAFAENPNSSSLTAFGMDGVSIGDRAIINTASATYINYFMRRAVGFMDDVCDTGTGSAHAITHNLTVAPEMVIRKARSDATQWEVWHSALANTEKLVLDSTAIKATDTTAWNSTTPTASAFTVGTGANVNTNGATYDTLLFATLAGISKVGSYTGNGSSQTINCGFAAGARFILIKRITGATGDWYVWDSTRGIVSGNDPHLSLNSSTIEVTTDDSIDPDTSGFIVNQVAATNINVSGATYAYFAIA